MCTNPVTYMDWELCWVSVRDGQGRRLSFAYPRPLERLIKSTYGQTNHTRACNHINPRETHRSVTHLHTGRGWTTGRTTRVGAAGCSRTAGGPSRRSSANPRCPVSWRHSRNSGKARLPRVSRSRTSCLAWSRLVPELWRETHGHRRGPAPHAVTRSRPPHRQQEK